METVGLAVVSEVVDSDKFIIRVDQEGVISGVLAYPLTNDDVPAVGEEVFVFMVETILGYSYLYQKVRLASYTKFEFSSNKITLTNDGILIKTDDGLDIVIKSSGDLDLSVEGELNINVSGAISIKSDSSIEFDAPMIKFPAGQVSGGPGGPFCILPSCPYSGSIHQGNILTS